jgi:transcriptional regulator with XRE-family HTH domain
MLKGIINYIVVFVKHINGDIVGFMKNINDLSPIKQRFYTIFKSTGLTQAEFGRVLGKSQKLISSIINNRRGVSADMIQLLRYKLNVNPEYILHGTTPMFLPKKIESGAMIPLIADIPAGDWRFWYDSYAVGAGRIVLWLQMSGERTFRRPCRW